ncbi:hypothetical protein DTO166G4_3478 [Paecilomyces variotii]|uniref:Transformer-SR ribonucleo protein, variant n=1 Tax=Byssochlamys spectabilis TaxID=264951 RepID=A0A443HT45_BYSSP|nr:transformer-SR ribonucleo protein, variant [Paecilomyces variotii]KAJ9192331.1 hypothetical protein DTO032I3_8391 [Paecilomyces variotii]KAJ9207929.1 hypothetical protein DTO164E3_215 [Paecilomyces variotii]KAJ9214886.1 hypothetical protein DTO166G4_3478 [Paecilomyces variotii]KAJ9227374.1 hypothetical protein DTO169C6_15 [Paecilomyces variotii]KAJ9238433.1 hypothetical protein DTO166G5_2981 [Paecilomyces variotii]
MATAEYENENGRYDDEPRFDRDRSASPREDSRGERTRSRSPNGRASDRAPPSGPRKDDEDEGAVNPGSNLFVTGINPRLTEADVSRLFEKYGDVENCSIMVDPHTKESRGFGFVKMVTAEQADAAKEGLQGEVIEGRTLSIEKARRSRPRTPTPGKYFGPPKREFRGPPRRGGDRYDDRRGGGYGYGRRGDDRYSRYDSYSDRSRDYDRGYGRRDYRDYRDDYGGSGSYRGIDRYSGRGEDRYSRDERRGEDRRGGDDRRGGGGGYYDRDANPPSYDSAPARDSRDAYSSRSYDGARSGEDRYSGR